MRLIADQAFATAKIIRIRDANDGLISIFSNDVSTIYLILFQLKKIRGGIICEKEIGWGDVLRG